MFSLNTCIIAVFSATLSAGPLFADDFGRTPTAAEIALWDIDIRPDGRGLPEGNGTVALGKPLFEDNCSACHGIDGRSGPKDHLVGGQGTLATAHPDKTIGSYWPYATTLFDYIRRAMPYQAPGSLTDDETYSIVAYLLSLNGILPASAELDEKSLPKIKMPNRDGFIPEPEFRKITNSR